MFIDRITTADKQLLIIKSDRGTRSYEWLTGAWEPVELYDVDEIVISENVHVQGIQLSD